MHRAQGSSRARITACTSHRPQYTRTHPHPPVYPPSLDLVRVLEIPKLLLPQPGILAYLHNRLMLEGGGRARGAGEGGWGGEGCCCGQICCLRVHMETFGFGMLLV